ELRPLPLAFPVEVAALAETDGMGFDLQPEAEERAAVAAYLGLNGLPGLGFRGTLAPSGGGWALTGRLTARMLQSCVVTLEPVETAVDVAVERIWLPDVVLPEGAEIELGADDDTAPEPLGDDIDLAGPMVDALALEIDPFPRAPGAEHGTRVYAPPGAEPLTEEAARPFAGLADLKARLERGDGSGEDDGGKTN
ncbi:MAG: DUF177 domain-containing protein, partial [Pseudomonadota bacterium]